MHTEIRIAVIDDHPLFREGVIHTLQSTTDMEVVGQGATASDAVGLSMSHRLDIMLLDVGMPGGGLEAAREIRRISPSIKTVMLTGSESEQHVAAALQIGVSGYIVKGCSGLELLQIVRAVSNGEPYITPALAARLLAQTPKPAVDSNKPPDIAALTHRENQVLNLLSQGLKNKEIALRLKLTEKTVKHYMTELMQKLNARNRVEVVLIAGSARNTTEPARHARC